MRKQKYALGAIFVLIVVAFFLSYQFFQPTIFSGILPTQTSIYSGPVVDSTLIAELQKPQWNGKINRAQAIGLAELYCAYAHSVPQENPSNIEASLLTEKEAKNQWEDDASGVSNKPVWLVSMDGLWEYEGHMTESGTVVPLLFRHCEVIIYAQTGEMSSLRSSGQK